RNVIVAPSTAGVSTGSRRRASTQVDRRVPTQVQTRPPARYVDNIVRSFSHRWSFCLPSCALRTAPGMSSGSQPAVGRRRGLLCMRSHGADRLCPLVVIRQVWRARVGRYPIAQERACQGKECNVHIRFKENYYLTIEDMKHCLAHEEVTPHAPISPIDVGSQRTRCATPGERPGAPTAAMFLSCRRRQRGSAHPQRFQWALYNGSHHRLHWHWAQKNECVPPFTHAGAQTFAGLSR